MRAFNFYPLNRPKSQNLIMSIIIKLHQVALTMQYRPKAMVYKS